MKNPFEFGRELGADELVDRESELASVEKTIRNAGKLFLVGPRRYGKTSILKAASEMLASAVVVRLDAESCPTLEVLAAEIVAGSARSLKGGVKRAGEQVRRFFRSLRPELDYRVSEQSWTVKLGVGSAPEDHAVVLMDALNGFEDLAQSQAASRPVGLIIDEFQHVVELGGQAVEGQIRAAIQRHRRTGYVFAGSKTRLLTAMTMDAARPFYRLGTVHFLGPVPRTEFEKFLQERFVRGGFSVERDAISRILDLAEDVPYNVQMLASGCWERLRDDSSTSALTSAFVEQTLMRLVRQNDPFFVQLWTTLTSIQQRTLLAVIEQQGVNLQSTRTAQSIGKGPATVRKSLQSMIERSILREEQDVKGLRLRFEDPFFSQWIRLTVVHMGWAGHAGLNSISRRWS